jgi:signal transduction histidine kinase
MAAADIPKALEIFRQIDNRYSRAQQGAGLGLPLAKRLVELHGGSFDIESTLGVGTRVMVRMPAARVIAAAPASASIRQDIAAQV